MPFDPPHDPREAGPVSAPGPRPRAHAGADVWIRTVVGWHIAFWGVVALAGLRLLLTTDLTGRERAVAAALVAVLALTYLLAVHLPGVITGTRAGVYLGVAVVVTGLACWVDTNLSMLLFIVYPQTWMFVRRLRTGVALNVALTAASTLGFVAGDDWRLSAAREFVPQMTVSLLFSVLLGVWITRIIDQSAERAELIAQLEAARTELAEAHHAQGVMAERERLAREIHDTLAQGFTSVVMLAQAAGAALDKRAGVTGARHPDGAGPGGGHAASGQDPVRDRLLSIEAVARENLAEARALVAAFSPVPLEGSTLQDAVRRLADRFGAETGARVDLQVIGAAEGLTRDREVVLLRAAQEALANVRRHARAARVSVRLISDESGVRVEIGDDGVGFAPGRAAEGYGLSGMRGRVSEVGGELDVASTPGGGTRVAVRVPRSGVTADGDGPAPRADGRQ